MKCYICSDRGRVRENNEDYCCTVMCNGFTVMVLADGMGGYSGGEIASRQAVTTIIEYIRENLMQYSSAKQIEEVMNAALYYANKRVYNRASEAKVLSGMGTTADICIVGEDKVHVAHIGDSRVYVISKDGTITRLTRDHSLVERLVEEGEITPQEAKTHPQRHIITRAVGTGYSITSDKASQIICDTDVVLMCSDGLTNMLSDETIAQIINQTDTLANAADELVSRANEAGGTDNISVIVGCRDEKAWEGR